MKSRKVLIGIGIGLTALVIIHYARTRKKREKKRIHIANEGYETAEDILYPRRRNLKLS
jgi:predicted small secreted protein